MLMQGLDAKQREEMDSTIYGWDAVNRQAERRLHDLRGGEED